MVNKSKKSKSKRVPLRGKHKIMKKLKEHHKKKAKEAKKVVVNRKQKVEKDPGIPNDFPFKEEEPKALEDRRARKIEELEQKKEARKEGAQKRKLGLPENDDIAKLADTASAKNLEFESKSAVEDAAGIDKRHDHSERSFYKELVKVIEASDVILEVLDARDPLGTRCLALEKMVLKSDPNKRIVLLLNKIDLVPREAAEKWLKYLREEMPAVAFKCSTQEQRANLGWKSVSKAAKSSKILQTSDCLGAETLIKLLKNYSRSREIKVSITVGIVGLPNVGKSSLINSLKRSHVVNVGSTPGLTRSMQEIHLDKNVKLLDCPGVVMLKSDETDVSISLRNCKRIEKLDNPISPVEEILKLIPAERLISLYKMPSFSTVDDFLRKVAIVRGRLKKGGVLDIEAAAKIVLHDWNEGKIPYYTMPPVRNQEEKLVPVIVSELGKEFDVDEVYNTESSFIGSLASVVDGFHHLAVLPGSLLNSDEQMMDKDDVELKEATGNKVEPMACEGKDPVEAGNKVEPMACEGKDPVEKEPKIIRRQNEKLYTAEGILDPCIRRAEKKRRKWNKLSSMNAMDADFDFKADYGMKEPTPDVHSVGEDQSESKDNETTEVPMAGFQLTKPLASYLLLYLM